MMRFLKRAAIALVIIVVLIEVAARVTRWTHNVRAEGLDDNLFVRTSGSGRPVLLLHGFRGSGRYWGHHLDDVAGRRMIYVDLLGFGQSPWPVTAYTTAEHLEAIHRSFHRRNAKVTVVGHSLGALLALEYAHAYRDEVDRVIVLGLPVFENAAEGRERVREMSSMAATFSFQPFAARASCDVVCALRPLLWHTTPLVRRDIPPEVARDAVLHRWESFDRTLRNVVLRTDAARLLRELRGIPVTIIQGRTDGVTDHERLRRLAAETGAELIFVDGDHNAYLRHPKEISTLIAERLIQH